MRQYGQMVLHETLILAILALPRPDSLSPALVGRRLGKTRRERRAGRRDHGPG